MIVRSSMSGHEIQSLMLFHFQRIVKEQLNHDPNGILYKREIMQYLEMIENGTLPDTQKESHVMVRRDVSTDTHLPVTATGKQKSYFLLY